MRQYPTWIRERGPETMEEAEIYGRFIYDGQPAEMTIEQAEGILMNPDVLPVMRKAWTVALELANSTAR